MEGDYGTKRQHPLFTALRQTIATQLDVLESQLDHNDEHLSFDGLDRQVIAVDDFASIINEHTYNLRAKLERDKKRLARDRNSMLAIHRLPGELFTDILMQTREGFWDLDTRTVVRWTTVCSRWRHIIISTPILWRRIDLADADILELALLRNASTPLEVHWCGPILGNDEDTARRANSAHAAYRSLAPRCRDLYIYTIGENDESMEILQLHGAYASKIMVFAHDASLNTLPERPNLESLISSHAEFSPAFWSSSRISGLQTLYLASLRGLPTDAQFYHMLASSPRLSTLVLADVEDPSRVDHRDLNSTAPILLLPNLRILHAVEVPTRLVRLIATKLQCPNCDILQVWELCQDDTIPDMPLLQSLNPATWSSCDLVASETISVSGSGGKSRLLPNFPIPASRRDLDIRVEIYLKDQGSWRDAVSALSVLIPSVHSLRVSHRGPNLRDLLEYPWQARKVYLRGPIPFLLEAVQVLGERRSRAASEGISGGSLFLPQLAYLCITYEGLATIFGVQTTYPEEALEELVNEVVKLAWTYSSQAAATDDGPASRLQIVGMKRLMDSLRTKDVPPNVVLGLNDEGIRVQKP